MGIYMLIGYPKGCIVCTYSCYVYYWVVGFPILLGTQRGEVVHGITPVNGGISGGILRSY